LALADLYDTLLSYVNRKLDAEGWRDVPYPEPLLAYLKEAVRVERLRVNPGRRKARHFAAACCRRVEHLFRFPQLAGLLAMVEEYAEGRIGLEELLVATRKVKAEVGDEVAEPSQLDWLLRRAHRLGLASEYEMLRTTPADRLAHAACLLAADGDSANAVDCWQRTAEAAANAAAAANAGADLAAELAFQADLLRDLFGNPFIPAAFDPHWRTSAVLDLAASVHESGDYAAMPILADALQEAGCEDAEVLGHCRAAPVHARGCWVVDAIRGV
jgi:hypothetical protein